MDNQINNTAAGGILKATCSIEKVRYYKNNWGIVLASVDRVREGTPKTDKRDCLTLVGVMAEPHVGDMINITGEYVEDPKWGSQYKLISCYSAIEFGENDEVGQKKYLASIFTPLQVKNMYQALENPFKVLKYREADELLKVSGCGMKRAWDWIDRFRDNYDKAKLYVALEDYNLTNHMIDKLLEHYKSPEVVIEKVKSNPYVLCTEINGIGWLTADKIALKGGMAEDSPVRIGAYMQFYLHQRAEQGASWITSDELLGAVLQMLGEEISDEAITAGIHGLMDKLWYNEDKSRIGLKYYYDLEMKIAQELIRIRDAEQRVMAEDWEEAVRALESRQGWKFDGDQMTAIRTAMENNIIMIMGPAGVGKSSTASAILRIYRHYSFGQCAFAGRAAANLSEITEEKGHTIHRLLGFPNGPDNKQHFAHHDENKLGYDIIIVDECSMIDAKLFYYLIRAIPDGAKLMLLGDPGQLESIGNGNIAHDLRESSEIPSVMLNTIHRQAAKSAIITESQKIRHGEQLVPKDWAGEETRGELQDLTLHCYSDSSNTYYKVMECFSRSMERPDFNILQTQVIVPRKTSGAACTYILNNAIQELCNPAGEDKKEYIGYLDGRPYILREGDKVINLANNYKTSPPIYNGNLGVLREFKTVDVCDEETGDYDHTENIAVIDFVGIGTVDVQRKDLGNIIPGYAITVHKAQGSQWDHVIFGVDFSSYSQLTSELVYTGITRAKIKCDLVAQTGALRMATATKSVSYKQTHLVQCLEEAAHPKIIF